MIGTDKGFINNDLSNNINHSQAADLYHGYVVLVLRLPLQIVKHIAPLENMASPKNSDQRSKRSAGRITLQSFLLFLFPEINTTELSFSLNF